MSNLDFSEVVYVKVSGQYDGQRLDNFLIRILKNVPKSRIYNLIRKGEIRINKGRCKADSRLAMDDIIRIPPIRSIRNNENPVVSNSLKKYISENILFEDKDLLVFNKPSGLAVHGGSGISMGVIEAFRSLRKSDEYLELAHRIDKDTSGCLIIAKSRLALSKIGESLQSNQVKKTYVALVKGNWPKGKSKVNAPLKKNTLLSGERIVKVDKLGKRSVTNFEITEKYENTTLLKINLETGRTHQIRVHCQFSGMPIVGDEKYGDTVFNSTMKNFGVKRMFLHASKLKFKHPNQSFLIDVMSPLPDDLKITIDKLNANELPK